MKKIYVCGPTVYNKPHIGNLRPILIFDIFSRALKALGDEVALMHNITDIDDKIIDKAISENVSEKEISERYTKVYEKLLKDLNITTITDKPKVTENIDGIIDFIKIIMQKGFAYESDGNVYFDVTKSDKYGSVSNRTLEEMRFELNDSKKHPGDFALWKQTEKGIQFQSPWGPGRPGWHTECAYFVNSFTSNGVDWHGGGIDLLFPHHENENAQFTAANNKPITKEWKQTGHINIDGDKMSKSLGNIMDAQEFLANNNNNTLRMIFLMTSPTAPINITEQIIKDANEKILKFEKAYKQITIEQTPDIKNNSVAHDVAKWDFASAMKKLNKYLREFNTNNFENSNTLIADLFLLGIFNKEDIVSDTQKNIFLKWKKLLNEKNFEEADKLRAQLIADKIL